jgi:hypothetical protein
VEYDECAGVGGEDVGMKGDSMKIPYNRELGYYKVWLKKDSELFSLYKMPVITARMIERTQKNGTHRFLDLPRPRHGLERIELVSKI